MQFQFCFGVPTSRKEMNSQITPQEYSKLILTQEEIDFIQSGEFDKRFNLGWQGEFMKKNNKVLKSKKTIKTLKPDEFVEKIVSTNESSLYDKNKIKKN